MPFLGQADDVRHRQAGETKSQGKGVTTMATYRFAGVKKAPEAKAEQCCEPVCGPTTCGTSAEVKEEPEAKLKTTK